MSAVSAGEKYVRCPRFQEICKVSRVSKGGPGPVPPGGPSGDVGVGEAPKPGGKDDDVIDAEFEVKK